MISAVVIDDEYLARQRVIKLLSGYNDIKLIGEARNGKTGIAIIDDLAPDLVFLDIQMPDMDGFEVIQKIRSPRKPYIIFTTAFDSYAIKAFNIHALDYLLKPYDTERFAESIKKVVEHFQLKRTSDVGVKLMGLINEYRKEEEGYLSTFKIREKGREINVECETILYLGANGNYLNLKTVNKVLLYRTTMNKIENQLNPERFLRIHRSLIVNKMSIQKCRYLNNNEYEFLMKNGDLLRSGRSYKDGIVKYLEQ